MEKKKKNTHLKMPKRNACTHLLALSCVKAASDTVPST
jgi:hypothetical protein